MSEPEDDFFLTVKVRTYGGVTAEEAAQALRDYPASIDLPGQREMEILDAQVLSIVPTTMGASQQARDAHNIAVYTANG